MVVGVCMKIRDLRKRANITQKELAKKMGISQQAVAKWEKGKSYPSIKRLSQLATILCCEISDLVASE